MSNTLAVGVKVMYKKVEEAIEELIGALGTIENKAKKIAFADHHHVNQCFDLLRLVYPDWPSVELKDSKVGKKRKQAGADDTLMSTSKQGGHGRGHRRARGFEEKEGSDYGCTTPDTHGRPHGLCPQGRPSPQDEALWGTTLLGVSRRHWEDILKIL